MNFTNERIPKIFLDQNIEYVSAIPFERCKIINAKKLAVPDFEPKSAIVFAIPYFSGLHKGNISLYAMCEDYHIYASQLFEVLTEQLSMEFEGACFKGFADSSPIDEVNAAALCGLGVVGENGMLITEKYSSFVFLASILCDLELDAFAEDGKLEIKHCVGCGKCKKACPGTKHGECLSAVTQKKGELAPHEKEYILKYGYAWGCDICQLVCPYTEKMISSGITTPIEFFKNDLIHMINKKTLEEMSKECFLRRAFSWRGKNTIMRNVLLWEK